MKARTSKNLMLKRHIRFLYLHNVECEQKFSLIFFWKNGKLLNCQNDVFKNVEFKFPLGKFINSFIFYKIRHRFQKNINF